MISGLSNSDYLIPISLLTDQQQQALLKVVYRIRESLDIQQILDTTAAEIRQMLDADRVGIFRFQPYSNSRIGAFVAESVVTGYASAIATPVEDNCFGEEYADKYEQGRIQAVSNIYEAGLSQCHIDVLAQFQVQANLIVPLRIKGHLWGLFCVHQCRETREWKTQEVEFIRHLSSHLDIALQQSELLENTLQQSKRLRTLTQERDRFFSLSPNLFCVLDFSGEFIRLNPAWSDILGYVQDELLYSNFWTFVHPEDEALTDEAFRNLKRHDAKQDLSFEHRFRCADGSYKYLAWSGTCITEEQRIYAIARDITKQKELELALEHRSEDLEQTLTQLQQTQTRLVQSAKMSSLGQLVAGVAHEINNPVNFIAGNINYIEEYSTQLIEILSTYQTLQSEPSEELEELCEEVDLEFVLRDLPKVISSMQLGTNRIKEIVLSLRNFSRLDEASSKIVDIHEGLDSTLRILQNRIRPKPHSSGVAIVKEYSDLPKIECYPGRLNQVFMNILSNGLDAIADSAQYNCGRIVIQTEFLASKDIVNIIITDNGCGMDQETSERIFDPFFTTKEVGKGTGLGMSISYQIVTEHHQGQLRCNSTPGVGTEFVITLPCHPDKKLSRPD